MAKRALSRARGADEGDGLAGRDLEAQIAQHVALAVGVRVGDLTHDDVLAGRIGTGEWALGVGDRVGLVEDLEDPLGRGHAVGGGVKLGADLAQRQVELGSEHEDGQPRGEGEVARGELHADRRGDERRAEHRQELEHQCRQERDTQRPHRLAPVAVADRGDRLELRLGAPVGTQCLQAADDVEEMGREASRACASVSRVRCAAALPSRIMKIGISGNVTARIAVASRLREAVQMRIAGGAIAATTSWGR